MTSDALVDKLVCDVVVMATGDGSESRIDHLGSPGPGDHVMSHYAVRIYML